MTEESDVSAEQAEAQPLSASVLPAMADIEPAPVEVMVAKPVEASAFVAPQQAAPIEAPAPVAAPVAAPAPATAPVAAAPVETYELPLQDLQAVAEGAGLQWVGSDPAKIRAAQEAMAAEFKPAKAAREPKPVEQIDQGPLVLVETRKDLAQTKLPFDRQE